MRILIMIVEWDRAERTWWKKKECSAFNQESLDKQSVWNYYNHVQPKNAGEFSVTANVFAFVVPGYCAIRILRRQRNEHAAQNVSAHAPDTV